MSPKVSIIMPVYNAEKFLREALDSVLAQTLTEIEVLCVDDGSTDASLEILREYAAKDARLTVYTQNHQFAGAARNLGIKHAAGKYLLFLDADDIFDPQLVEKSYNRAEETSADICVFGGEIFYDDTGERSPLPDLCRTDLCPETVFSSNDHPEEIFSISTPGPWNKLFRREFITAEGIDFPNLRTAEDLVFVMTAFACANRVALLNEPLVHYRQHSASLMHTQDKDPWAFYAALVELRERLIDRGLYESLKTAFSAMAALNCCSNLSTMNTLAAFKSTYAFIRDAAIPELGLADLSDTADRLYPADKPAERIRAIMTLSAEDYIPQYGPRLKKVIAYGDPLLSARTILKRVINRIK